MFSSIKYMSYQFSPHLENYQDLVYQQPVQTQERNSKRYTRKKEKKSQQYSAKRHS